MEGGPLKNVKVFYLKLSKYSSYAKYRLIRCYVILMFQCYRPVSLKLACTELNTQHFQNMTFDIVTKSINNVLPENLGRFFISKAPVQKTHPRNVCRLFWQVQSNEGKCECTCKELIDILFISICSKDALKKLFLLAFWWVKNNEWEMEAVGA